MRTGPGPGRVRPSAQPAGAPPRALPFPVAKRGAFLSSLVFLNVLVTRVRVSSVVPGCAMSHAGLTVWQRTDAPRPVGPRPGPPGRPWRRAGPCDAGAREAPACLRHQVTQGQARASRPWGLGPGALPVPLHGVLLCPSHSSVRSSDFFPQGGNAIVVSTRRTVLPGCESDVSRLRGRGGCRPCARPDWPLRGPPRPSTATSGHAVSALSRDKQPCARFFPSTCSASHFV